MAIGVGIALTGWTGGLGASELVRRLRPASVTGPILTGMAARFMLTVTLLLAALLASSRQWPGLRHGWPKLPLVVWVLIGYLSLLLVDAVSAGLRRPVGHKGGTAERTDQRPAPVAGSPRKE